VSMKAHLHAVSDFGVKFDRGGSAWITRGPVSTETFTFSQVGHNGKLRSREEYAALLQSTRLQAEAAPQKQMEDVQMMSCGIGDGMQAVPQVSSSSAASVASQSSFDSLTISSARSSMG